MNKYIYKVRFENFVYITIRIKKMNSSIIISTLMANKLWNSLRSINTSMSILKKMSCLNFGSLRLGYSIHS